MGRSIFKSMLPFLLGSFIANANRSAALSPGRSIFKTQSSGDTDFNWTAVEPSDTLNWITCYGSFECARFTVPLDYNNASTGEAAIAIAKLPSPIQPGQDGYKGQILVNPGGPGDSGVNFVLELPDMLRQYVGDGFDILGFDPRGVGFTTPPLVVFQPGPEEIFQAYLFARAANESKGSIGALYATSQTIGKVAEARVPDIGPYVSTPAVARDMLSIVNASGSDKLQYWGFSYGTALGATFAALFPDNVGRLIIDGVVDSEAYYAGGYGHDLADSDKALNELYQACVDAGPSNCPIYESSTDKVRARVDKLVDSSKAQPASFYNGTTGEYAELDYSTTKFVMLQALYSPYLSGPALLFALAAAEQGEVQPLYDFLSGPTTGSPFECPTTTVQQTGFSQDFAAEYSVRCGDISRPPLSLDDLKIIYAEMAQDSPFFAEIWRFNLGCAGWTIRANDPVTPKFNTPTNFPLLIIGNTADPVEPLRNAHKMSGLFEGSVVLTQNSSGHTSIAANSSCTASIVRSYFEDGKLPEKGTICGINSTYDFSQ